MRATVPIQINLGSGKNFRDEYLNIDINDYWGPDIVLDMSVPLSESGRTFATKRFGGVTLGSDAFEEIMANDVLEHIPDLIAAMTNCLTLLKTGGVFHVSVPYDLSYGAWQDPTHVRAFNERSWLYYTDWFWYVGWETHRFTLRSLEYTLSPEGHQMMQSGQPNEVVLRTPRMVDSMKVALVKTALSDADKAALAQFKGSRRE